MNDPIGATPEDLASMPGLLLDLSLSLVPRRVATAHGLLALLGGCSREKVAALLNDVATANATIKADCLRHMGLTDQLIAGRDLMTAVARLENAVYTLCVARIKAGMRLVPTALADMVA